MFGAKPAASKQPWLVQVLTPDYLVEGHFDEGDENYMGLYFFRAWPDLDGKLPVSACMHLTNARFQSMSNLTLPPSSATDWFGFPNNMLALFPRDELSLAYMFKNNAPKNLIPAEIYVGPYLIKGTILCPEKSLIALRIYFNFAVQDAVIECLTPGAKFQSHKEPFVMVRTHLVQGIIPQA
jgi:hypothetical protein